MFSKFLAGKDESMLQAMEMQWKMEYLKAKRKFAKKKESENKKGRPPLKTLQLSLLEGSNALNLTEIARKVATTQSGARVHHRAMHKVMGDDKKASLKTQVCLCLPVCLFVCFLFFF